MLWLAIYHAMGIRYSATVPLIYLAVSAATLGDLPVESQFRVLPLRADQPVPVRAVHHAVVDRQLRDFLGRDAVGVAGADRRDDLPGAEGIGAVVFRLHRDDRGVGIFRLLPRLRHRAADRHADADDRGVLRAQFRRDVDHRLPAGHLFRARERPPQGRARRAARPAARSSRSVRSGCCSTCCPATSPSA